MKLRMETGNFNVVIDTTKPETAKAYLPKGLTAEDFVGLVVTMVTNTGTSVGAIFAAAEATNNPGKISCIGASGSGFVYDIETGVLTPAGA